MNTYARYEEDSSGNIHRVLVKELRRGQETVVAKRKIAASYSEFRERFPGNKNVEVQSYSSTPNSIRRKVEDMTDDELASVGLARVSGIGEDFPGADALKLNGIFTIEQLVRKHKELKERGLDLTELREVGPATQNRILHRIDEYYKDLATKIGLDESVKVSSEEDEDEEEDVDEDDETSE